MDVIWAYLLRQLDDECPLGTRREFEELKCRALRERLFGGLTDKEENR